MSREVEIEIDLRVPRAARAVVFVLARIALWLVSLASWIARRSTRTEVRRP